MLEIMFKCGILPKLFNVGKIIPIIIDKKFSNYIINIRQITISDTIAIIFEKYLLININAQLKDKKE